MENQLTQISIDGNGRNPGDVSEGDYAYDATSGTMYRVVEVTSGILTDRVNNYVLADAEVVGDAFSVAEDEFAEAWGCDVEAQS